jgi:Flp pilus assembly protein TadD
MIRVLIIMGFLATLFGCKKEDAAKQAVSSTPAVVVTNTEEHNAVYKRGTQLIVPHMQLLDRAPKVNDTVRGEVMLGIADLDAVTAYNPENWAAFWIKGKGYQVLGNHEAANAEFKSSFDLQKSNADVAREYASSCLELGKGDEAIRVNQHAITLTPDDAGLYANLALAFLIAGRNADSKVAIDRSLEMAPNDTISLAVRRVVDDVLSGKRPQPKKMVDLTKG